jgi:PhnB protein
MNTLNFAPMLYIRSGIRDVSFYTKALDAVEIRRFTNDDESIHVVEFSIAGKLFHLHEENHEKKQYSPQSIQGTSVNIGLFVKDVDAIMNKAIAAGAEVVSPAQDYEYGYRQGEFKDPFGHLWQIEKKI